MAQPRKYLLWIFYFWVLGILCWKPIDKAYFIFKSYVELCSKNGRAKICLYKTTVKGGQLFATGSKGSTLSLQAQKGGYLIAISARGTSLSLYAQMEITYHYQRKRVHRLKRVQLITIFSKVTSLSLQVQKGTAYRFWLKGTILSLYAQKGIAYRYQCKREKLVQAQKSLAYHYQLKSVQLITISVKGISLSLQAQKGTSLSRFKGIAYRYQLKRVINQLNHLLSVSDVFSNVSFAFKSWDFASSMNSSVFLICAFL